MLAAAIIVKGYTDVGDGWLIFKLPPAELGIHPAEHVVNREVLDTAILARRDEDGARGGGVVLTGLGGAVRGGIGHHHAAAAGRPVKDVQAAAMKAFLDR